MADHGDEQVPLTVGSTLVGRASTCDVVLRRFRGQTRDSELFEVLGTDA